MFLAGLFLAAFARSLASLVSTTVAGNANAISNPIAAIVTPTIGRQLYCDPTQTRTLFDILYSCIGVVFLCAYISVHHNIPDRNASTTLYALLAHEFVIMWAIRERIKAGRIAEKMKDHGWTKTHGFFVQMGGLVQVQPDSTYRVLRNRQRVPDGSGGTRFKMLDEYQIPRISEKEINDHGKGDVLAKAIVVIQTTWFVAQCIARHVQGLVLTEIELVTLAFATLNVITYGLWWDKPLNVEYPIYFDEEGKHVDGPEEKNEEAWYREAWKTVKGFLL
ncbi:hypothetical protein AX16_006824 [Volvariella volvacea WC 439]|nr:hypothetical protein AX16_006824 [Volvariella volvacea WC 439]